jgi:hypothetical protein
MSTKKQYLASINHWLGVIVMGGFVTTVILLLILWRVW